MSDAFNFARRLVFRAQASRISFTRKSSTSQINRWSFTNRFSAQFGYASLGVVNAYQAVPQPKKPLTEVDFLFYRRFCRKFFFVFSSSKVEYLRKLTFEMNFPLLDSMVYPKSKLTPHSSSRDCFAGCRISGKIIKMCGWYSCVCMLLHDLNYCFVSPDKLKPRSVRWAIRPISLSSMCDIHAPI